MSSLVAFDPTGSSSPVTTDPTLLSEFQDGGIWVATAVGSGLSGGQTLTLSAYSRVNQDSALRQAGAASITGASPVDPAVVQVGPIYSSELLSLWGELSSGGPLDTPWKVEQLARLRTIPGMEGRITATASVQTLGAVIPYGGKFYLIVDVGLMQSGDELKLRMNTAAAGPGSTVVVDQYKLLEDAQTNGIFVVGPCFARGSMEATLQQPVGTGRVYDWKVVLGE